MNPRADFRGNKSGLPAKPCARCGRTMVWRKKWRLNWESVKYCSDACRKAAKMSGTSPRNAFGAG